MNGKPERSALQPGELLAMYRSMVRIREFEEACPKLYSEGKIGGFLHLYSGQEAVAVGAVQAIGRDDYMIGAYREHGMLLAKGAAPGRVMAELFGRTTCVSKGKGGSMHLADMAVGILGANGIVGGGHPIATGAAWSAKWRGTDQVAVCFFGDAASNIGAFHESLYLAAAHKLPVVFVCENNGYGISVSQAKHQAIKDVADRAPGYGMPGVVVDGQDVLTVYEAASEAVQRARSGEGPTLLECKTYRFRGHHEGDPNQGERYRSREEIELWKKRCPIKKFEEKLLADKVTTKKKLAAIEHAITEELDRAVEFANASDYPALEELYADVYASVQEGEAR